jgi:hypothetical protein
MLIQRPTEGLRVGDGAWHNLDLSGGAFAAGGSKDLRDTFWVG